MRSHNLTSKHSRMFWVLPLQDAATLDKLMPFFELHSHGHSNGHSNGNNNGNGSNGTGNSSDLQVTSLHIAWSWCSPVYILLSLKVLISHRCLSGEHTKLGVVGTSGCEVLNGECNISLGLSNQPMGSWYIEALTQCVDCWMYSASKALCMLNLPSFF